jgi:hypothetical protein
MCRQRHGSQSQGITLRQKQPEPEHYSWSLGTPDNGVGTEVIVNPYGDNSASRNHPAYDAAQREMSQDYPSHINPYASSFSVSFDDNPEEVILPMVDPDGRNLDEEEAIRRYQNDGRNLGIFQDRKSADSYIKNKAPDTHFEMAPLDIGNLSAEDYKRLK